MVRVAAFACLVGASQGLCPYNIGTNWAKKDTANSSAPREPPSVPTPEYEKAVSELDIHAVQKDLKELFKNSQKEWPADYGNYGPFFIRLAWHCSGSYRDTDGRGGCSGGRQRFDPERSWEDNTNLDKARALLQPIKDKYGLGLSYGDLFIMAGTTAIQVMGGPTVGVCVGRVDDDDGSRSLDLGPTAEQEEFAPCAVNGNCSAPLGATTVGLIYVNPEGPMGVPEPAPSALEVRDTFSRMGMNDEETVALIGGGHAFGKTHGACPKGPGTAPDQTPAGQPAWHGLCGSGAEQGIGSNAFTSGFEGSWTRDPTKWDNEYFTNLLNYDWEVWMGPGGHNQWRVKGGKSPTARGAFCPDAGKPGGDSKDKTCKEDVMMLTSDISLLHDPENKYQAIVKKFAKDSEALDKAFATAWHKLTTRPFGAMPSSSLRCLPAGEKKCKGNECTCKTANPYAATAATAAATATATAAGATSEHFDVSDVAVSATGMSAIAVVAVACVALVGIVGVLAVVHKQQQNTKVKNADGNALEMPLTECPASYQTI